MIRLLNFVLIISAATFLTLVVFICVESLNILKMVPFMVLSLMFLVASFVLKLFIKNNELPKFIQWGVIILSILPLTVPLLGLVDPSKVEGNWPLMIAGLAFYSGLGLLSISGIFTKQNKPSFWARIFLMLFGLLLVVWFVFVLLRVSDSHLYNYTFLFAIAATVLYLIPLTIGLAKRN